MEIEEHANIMEVLPSFKKKYRAHGIWGTISLTKEEEDEIRQAHRKALLELLEECFYDAYEHKFTGDMTAIGLALFDKRSDHIWTMLQNKLSEKVENARNGAIKPLFLPEVIKMENKSFKNCVSSLNFLADRRDGLVFLVKIIPLTDRPSEAEIDGFIPNLNFMSSLKKRRLMKREYIEDYEERERIA